jgi:NTP pyrophosphatase (non-canonical NTP hydrolase)
MLEVSMSNREEHELSKNDPNYIPVFGPSLNDLRDDAYGTAKASGWHDEDTKVTFGDRMALITSEISEALEDFRNGKGTKEIYYTRKVTAFYEENGEQIQVDVEVPCAKDHPKAKPCGIPIELADALIRILDLAGKEGIDIEAAVLEKMKYNKTRSFRHGGKRI